MIRPRSISVLILALASLLVSGSAPAQTACAGEFGDALTAVQSASLSQGTAQKLATKVRNAARMYASASPNGKANALKELRVADDLIDGPSMKSVPTSTKQTLHASIDAVRACLTNAPAVQTTTLTVTVLALPGDGSTPQAAGANATVTVAGNTAKTNGKGIATLAAPVGLQTVVAELGNSAGYTKATLVAGTPAQVTVVMEGNRDTSARVLVTSPEIVDGVLPRDFAALTIRFETEAGDAVAIDRLDQVVMRAASEIRNFTPMFRASGGAISLNDRASFAAFILDRVDPFELNVHALDKAANAYSGTLRFAVGRFRPTPAIAGASPANVTFKLIHERSGFAFWSTSSADGVFAWPLLPDGAYLVEGETEQGGQRLYARSGFILDRDKTFPARFFAVTGTAPGGGTGLSTAAPSAAVMATTRENAKFYRTEPSGAVVPLDAPREKYSVIAINIDVNRDFGNFKARSIQDLDMPEPLPQSTEQELRDLETAVAAGISATANARPVTVRGLDAGGNTVYRQAMMVRTSDAGEVLRPAGEPAPPPADPPSATPPDLTLRVKVPASVQSIEIRGWRQGLVVLWETAALRADKSLQNLDARRGDQ